MTLLVPVYKIGVEMKSGPKTPRQRAQALRNAFRCLQMFKYALIGKLNLRQH